MKTYYLYDESGVFTGAIAALEAPKNATLVPVPDGLFVPSFDGTSWSGLTKEEANSENPQPEVPATAEQAAITALAQENSTLKAELSTVEQALTALATSQGGEK